MLNFGAEGGTGGGRGSRKSQQRGPQNTQRCRGWVEWVPSGQASLDGELSPSRRLKAVACPERAGTCWPVKPTNEKGLSAGSEAVSRPISTEETIPHYC